MMTRITGKTNKNGKIFSNKIPARSGAAFAAASNKIPDEISKTTLTARDSELSGSTENKEVVKKSTQQTAKQTRSPRSGTMILRGGTARRAIVTSAAALAENAADKGKAIAKQQAAIMHAEKKTHIFFSEPKRSANS